MEGMVVAGIMLAVIIGILWYPLVYEYNKEIDKYNKSKTDSHKGNVK